jgi:hypothetical protein
MTKKWQELPIEVRPYKHLFNNTGGLPPEEILWRYHNEKNLSFTNAFVFAMGVSIESQIVLLQTLHENGLLKQAPQEQKAN